MSAKHRFLSRLFAVAIALTVLARPAPAWACSCVMPPTPAEEFAQRQAVFVGTVTGTGINLSSIPYAYQAAQAWASWTNSTVPPGIFQSRFEFTVQDSWKGVTTTRTTIATTGSSASCGYEFVTGQQYLVYAYDFDGTGLQTNICTRTTEITNAAADLTYLNTQPKLTLSPSALPIWPIVVGGAFVIVLATGIVWVVRRRSAITKDML